MIPQTREMRLGEVLVKAGILDSQDLADILLQRQGEPNLAHEALGRILVEKGLITEELLQAALEVQSLFRDGVITKQECIDALRLVHEGKVDLHKALRQLSSRISPRTVRNRLGELLLSAEIINAAQLDCFLKASSTSGLSLGRVLVQAGVVSEGLIMAALTVQVLIREWKLTRDQGIEALRTAKTRQVPWQMREVGISDSCGTSTMRLGELILAAGLMTASQLMNAVETSLVNDERLGQVLLHNGVVSETELETSLRLQRLMAQGALQQEQAVAELAALRPECVTALPTAASEEQTLFWDKETEKLSFHDFLRLTGLIPKNVLDTLSNRALNQDLALKILAASNTLSHSSLRDCQRVYTLVCEGVLSLEKGILILRQSKATGKSVKLCVQDSGWMMPHAGASRLSA